MLNEKSIRPEEKRDYALKLMKQDLKKILKSDMVEINCPVCSSKKNQLVFKKNGYDFVKCLECSMIFIKKRPNVKVLDDFYNNSKGIKYWNSELFPVVENARIKLVYQPRVEYIKTITKKFIKIPIKFLEIGAGCGNVCQLIKKSKVFNEVDAIEFSKERALEIEKKMV
ncbi:MAG TPA: hypothetical protein PLJ39_12885 [Spirochaetota bacterium]|nr:hypothetical protein [Spirochaetota bacterium]HPN32572.1 hypothetical protein [bacterium]